MNSLKTEICCWLRYGKRLPIVCTEAGPWNSDVLGLSQDLCIEVETKASKADLRRDFTGKTSKWWTYTQNENSHTCPNFFYFAVPEALGQDTLNIVIEKAPKAGVIVHTDTNLLAGRNIVCLKKPVRMNKNPPSARIQAMAMMRMSSELCGMKIVADSLRIQLSNRIKDAFDEATEAAYRVAGTLDCEIDGDLDRIAEELAFCVDGVRGDAIQNLDKWRQAARLWIDAQYRTRPCTDDS